MKNILILILLIALEANGLFAEDTGVDSKGSIDTAVVDLAWRPNWNRHQITTGKVHEVIDASNLQKVIFIRAESPATPKVWVILISRALEQAGKFVVAPEKPATFWLCAVIITSDQRHYTLELAANIARLTTESGHGYFKIAKLR